nr:immunoglobulin light chain junction region [Macaca mulatta]
DYFCAVWHDSASYIF